jgi:large repetitive protein
MGNSLSARYALVLVRIVAALGLIFGSPSGAMAAVWTDQEDYSPGSVVTISGDNRNGAGYAAGETVDVVVSGPNGYAESCEAVTDANGAWSCQVTLWSDSSAVGSYSYTATGQTSGISESGAFTDGNVKVTAAPSGISFQLTVSIYATTNCTGALASLPGNKPNPSSQTITAGSEETFGVGNTESIKLEAAALSVQGTPFLAWSATGPFTVVSAPRTICVAGQFNGSQTYIANYLPAVANTPPVANNDTHTTNEDIALAVAAPGVLANDTDANSNPLTAVLVSGPTNGTLVLNADGSFTYTPSANFNGSDSFTYKANDGAADSNVATVSLTVNAVNDAPVADNDSYNTNEDAQLNVPAPGVLDGDADVDNASLTAILVSGPADGSLALNPDGSFTYTPNLDFNGTDGFTYKANDGTADSNVATVTITVGPVQDAPVANDDTATTNEDTPVNIDVLVNDDDPDNDVLTVLLVDDVTDGTLALNVDGSFEYEPDPDFNGSDGFTYKVNDGQADSNVATVSITVNAVNDAPTANDDAYSTNEDTSLTVAAHGVLNGDTDVEGEPLTAVVVTNPAHGTLTLNADGSFMYTPAVDYNGSDSFTYKANDGGADSNTATVTITVNPVNDAPVATNDVYDVDEDTSLTVALAEGVLGNDTDVEGHHLTAALVSGPSHGTLVLNADGSFTYTPAANYNGPDSFTYKANDGSLDSNVATVTITVNAVNDAPVATEDAYSTDEDTPLVVGAPGVLTNDVDVDGDHLEAMLVSGPSNGALTLVGDGSFTYTPAVNYNGPDSFTYKVNDGQADSNVATVSITVTAVNDAPVVSADADAVTVNEGQTAANSGKWSDIDSPGSAIMLSASIGNIIKNADGTWSWSWATTDGPDESGTVTITADDGSLTSTATFSLTVENVAPTVVLTGPINANEGETQSYNFSVTDPGADTFTVAAAFPDCGTGGSLVAGSLSVNTSGGSFDCLLPDGPASTTISIQVADSDGASSNTSTVAVTVANVAPTVALTGANSADEGQTKTYSFTVTDPGADTFSVAAGFPDCGTGGSLFVGSLAVDTSGGSLQCEFPDGPASPDVSIRVADSDGASSNLASIAVTVTNVTPFVNAGDDAALDEGGTFAQSGSFTDPGADTWLATVNYGDGSGVQALALAGDKTFALSHVYADNGTYTVEVCVTDDDSGLDCDTVEVTVTNVAPTATFNAPTSVNEGSPISLSLTDPSDPSSADTTAGFTYAFDCGSGYGLFSPTSTASCATTDNGTRTVKGKIQDKDGGFTEYTSNVTINNVAPTATIVGAPTSSLEGTTIGLTSTVIDPGTADTHTYAWSVTKDGNAYGEGTAAGFSFTPDDNGTYVVSLTVTDDDGGSGSDEVTVTITNVAPTATINGAPANSPEGTLIDLTGSKTDPGTADTHTFDWTVTKNGDAYAASTGSSFSFTPDDDGTYVVTLTVTDDDGGVGTATKPINVTNVAPVVTATPVSGAEGSLVTETASFTDAGTADTHECSIDWGDDSLATAGAVVETNGSGTCEGSHTYADDEAYTITVTVTDDDGDTGSDTDTATITNVAPANINLTAAPATINENASITLSGSFTDPGVLDTHTVVINWGDGSSNTTLNLPAGVLEFETTHQYLDDNPTNTASDDHTIQVTVTDKDGGSDSVETGVTVNNVAPVITSVTGPAGPLALGTSASVNVQFTDVGSQDTHTCTFAWDDGTPNTTVPASGGSCTGTHTYAAAGVYAVTVTVTDDDEGSDTAVLEEYIVIYNAQGGFVTGGGFINSPAGAYVADPTLTGKARFGFVSKYLRGANTPTGETEFNFSVARFNFHSSSYQWLVVSGAKAQYKGTGTVNGVAGYSFLLTATDGQVNGGGGTDKFRIKIWNSAGVVYDNVLGAPEDIDGANPQVIASGSIVIHR